MSKDNDIVLLPKKFFEELMDYWEAGQHDVSPGEREAFRQMIKMVDTNAKEVKDKETV